MPAYLAGPLRQNGVRLALCLLALVAAVVYAFRPYGLIADDYQYLFLVKGFFTGHAFENLHKGDGSLFLFRPFGYPFLLSAFYPILGQHWHLYSWTTGLFTCGLAAITFFCIRLHAGAWPALLLTLAMTANPILRNWSGYVYSDIPFAFFLMLFVYLHAAGKAKDVQPLLVLGLVALRTAGLPLFLAYGFSLILERDARRGLMLAALAAAYLAIHFAAFGQIAGLQDYFKLYIGSGPERETVDWPRRIAHNLHSLSTNLLTSAFFYQAYGWLQASWMKSLLCCLGALGVMAALAAAAGRAIVLHLFTAGFLGLLLMMKWEDVVHRLLLPLIPLAFLGVGRLWAMFPRRKAFFVGLTLALAVDGLLGTGSYRSLFEDHPRGYADLDSLPR